VKISSFDDSNQKVHSSNLIVQGTYTIHVTANINIGKLNYNY